MRKTQAPKARAKSAPKPAPATKAKPRKRHTPVARAHADGPANSNLSETLFRRTFDAAPVGSAIVDQDFTFTQVNTAFCQLLGYTEKELLGRSFNAITHPDDIAASRAGIEHLLTGQATTFEQEKRYLRKNGTIIWGLVSVSIVRDDTNQPLYLIPIIQDITERKRTEEALRESESNLQESQSIAGLGTYVLSITTGNWESSAMLDQIFGITRSTVHSVQEWEKKLHPDDQAMMTTYFLDHVVGQRQLFNKEYRIIRQNDQAVRWVHGLGRLTFGTDGQPIEMRGTIQDITERKLADEALRTSENRFRGLFDLAVDGILIGSPDGTCIETNRQLCVLVGRTREELLGKKIDVLFTPETLQEKPLRFDLLRQGQIVKTVRPIKRPDGLEVIVEMHSKMMPDGTYQSFFHDVTGQKQAEAALLTQTKLHAAELAQRVQERTAELEATNKELEAFSYSVSHDLRAPLRAIDGFSAILSADFMSRLDQEGQRVLGIICAEAKRMGLLIDDLLTFSRMNRLALQTGEIDMTALAQTIFDECAASVPDRQLQFKLKPLPTTQGDQPMIRQVLMNLVANAIKYTRPKPLAEIEIGGHEEAGEAIYHIKDNGVGFDQRYADKLFGVFQRLHTEDEFEGTGVGLALVQRVIHRHGGRVWAEAKVNAGATFYFTLPTKNKNP